MSWFLDATLSNALIAAAMSIVVLAISRYWHHRPAVVHAMWLIVLLKFVTPPLVNVPVSFGWSVHDVSVNSINNPRLELSDSLSVRIGAEEARQIAHESLSRSRDTAFQQLRPDFKTKTGLDFQVVVLGCWLTGSVVWILIAGIRIVRFSRLLRMARPADGLAMIGDRIARRIGLKQTPAIEVIDAHVGPLVWPVGFTPKIVLPADLVSKSTAEQLELVLSHEMVHVKRGDHWVHWFTLLVLAAFWWHPMAWLAVRRLRVAEEQCCDAMVVAASPGCALVYAEVLVKTLDLLVARRSPPVPASGFASGGSLKRRCEMILSDRTTFRVGRITGLLLLLAAITILPLAAMGHADEASEKKTAARQSQDAVAPKNDAGNPTPKVDEDAGIQAVFESHPHPWRVERTMANDCIKCHRIEVGARKKIGTPLSEWGDRKVKAEENEAESTTEEEERLTELLGLALRKPHELTERDRQALDGAIQGLRNLGFNDELIQTLIKDHTKARNANQVLQNILKLTAEPQQQPKQDEANNK